LTKRRKREGEEEEGERREWIRGMESLR